MLEKKMYDASKTKHEIYLTVKYHFLTSNNLKSTLPRNVLCTILTGSGNL